MRNRFVRFLLMLSAFWLPVQTMAAMSMPLCRHAQQQAVSAVVDTAMAMPCHEAHAAAVPDQAGHDAGCDNCEMCHLAGSGFMPSAPAAADLLPAARAFAPPAIMAPPSHIAEPPQHPPRASA